MATCGRGPRSALTRTSSRHGSWSGATSYWPISSHAYANRVQLTTDGRAPYLKVVEPLFGTDGVDFAQRIKLYGNEIEDERT